MEPVAAVKISYILNNNETFETTVKIYDYTEKSVAIQTTEHFGRAFTENLKEISRYNPKLNFGKGWVLSKNKYSTLQKLMTDISEGKIKGNIPPETIRRRSICLSGLILEPTIVSSFKNIDTLLAENKESKNIYISGNDTYVWGKRNEVFEHIVSLGKEVKTSFTHGDIVMVVV